MATLSRLLISFGLALIPAAVRADCTIYVTHNNGGDGPFWQFASGSDNEMWLREAAEVGRGDARCYTDFEKDRIIGGNFIHDPVFCGTLNNTRNWILNPINTGCGPNNADTIRFWDGINGGPNINLGKRIVVDPRDSIDGAPDTAGARSNIALIGPGPSGPDSDMGAIQFDTFSSASASGAVRNLYIDNFRFFGIWASKVSGLSIKGVNIARISVTDTGYAYGVVLGEIIGPAISNQCVFNAQVGGSGNGEQNYFFDIAYTAISLWDTCSGDNSDRNNKIYNNYVGLCEELDTGVGLEGCLTGTPAQGIGQRGISIFDTPNTRIGGTGTNERNYIARSGVAGIQVGGTRSRDTRVISNWIGLSRTGFGRGNAAGVVLAFGAFQNQIGGVGIGEGNVISSNTQHGVRIDGGDANVVSGNVIGLNTTRTQARGNGSDGVAINGAATNAVIANNVIGYNAGWGIYAGGSSGHTISGNVIGLRGETNTSNDNTAAPNGGGIWLDNSANNVIGTGNRIAGNSGFGIRISGEGADGNRVRGNIIGLSSGNDRRPNSVGIFVDSSADANTIGGAAVADRNTISGNTFEGIRITDSNTNGNIVRGNYIGTIPSGLGAAQNASRGVSVDTGAGATQIIGNLISGNNVDGIALIGAASATKVQSNTIGLAFDGSALPNTAAGIAIAAGTTGALIGDAGVGNTIAANGSFGVYITDAGTGNNTISSNFIGGSTSTLANTAGGITLRLGTAGNNILANIVIGHSNGPGIEIIGATNNSVRGNRVGMTASGLVAANQAGVRVVGAATGNVIGGVVADRNWIGGNTLYGISFAEAGTNNNTALNNYIGVDPIGTSAKPNGIGVLIESGARNNTVSTNLISGNSGDGVLIQGTGSDDNRVQANRIGLAASGTAVLANGGDGVRITANASNALIGTVPVQANLIRGNLGTGVRVESGNGNDISFNNIFGNGGLGIDIGPLGISANDALDADSGGNDILNFPTLSNVVQNGAMASMTVTQNGLPSKQHGVQVYASSACDGSGSGEGETHLDGLTFTTNAAGSVSMNVIIPLPSSAPVVAFSATANAATASGGGENTSEFSPCATTPIAIFANSFEPTTRAPETAKTDSASIEVSGIARISEERAVLTLIFENPSAHKQAARSIDISSDRAIIIEAINSDHAACALFGAIVCEIPALAPGQQARVVVHIGNARNALKMMVREQNSGSAKQRHDFLLLPY
jgi:parallel beta-helix repeat protein